MIEQGRNAIIGLDGGNGSPARFFANGYVRPARATATAGRGARTLENGSEPYTADRISGFPKALVQLDAGRARHFFFFFFRERGGRKGGSERRFGWRICADGPRIAAQHEY